MLRIYTNRSAEAAKRYFDEELRLGDYYSEGQEIAGNWGGAAAHMLGLSGAVDRDAFHALCDNLHPGTGGNLTARTKENRRVGYDFNFNAPKKLSVLYALTRDDRILDAFRASVQETMGELERQTACRVRDHGMQDERTTGNLAFAEFVHFTARPVDGVPDPELHAHCFVFNATWDGEQQNRDGTTGMWKAIDVAGIKADGRYYEAAFHARLSRRMAEMGYGVERDGKGYWDVALPEGVRDKFSRRTQQIEAEVEARGVSGDKEKAAMAAATREAKAKGVTLAELRQTWDGRLSTAERAAIHASHSDADGTARLPGISTTQAMEHAVEHGFERQSAIPVAQLKELALRRGFGDVGVEDVSREVETGAANGTLLTADIKGRAMVTTRQVLGEERAMVAYARNSRGTCAALGPEGYVLKDGLFHDPTKDTAEQQEAIRHVLASHDRIIALAGGAGTGKTTVMREIASGIAAGGRELFAFAPGSEASRGVLRREGFDNATTVAALLHNRQLQDRLKGQVILIDEAGTLGVQDMHAVFRIARKQDARVILSGDTRQHAAVARGDALRVLEEWGGVDSFRIDGIQRQRDNQAYLRAVEAVASGNVLEGFDRLHAMGAVCEFAGETAQERHQQLAADYLRVSAETGRKGKPKEALVVAPTHAEGAAVTAHIRAGLKAAGSLAEKDRELPRLLNLSRTGAEKRDAVLYKKGQVVQFHQNVKGGFKAGSRWEVVERTGDAVKVRHEGEERTLPLEAAARFDVFEGSTIALAEGERIRITRGGFTADRKHRLNNGAVYQVAGFSTEGNIRLDNGWEVDADFGHMAHGYVSTSHAAQGRTVDAVFIAQGSESLPASSLEQFYVSVSRGRTEVKLYTDDAEELRRVIQKTSTRTAALDIAGEKEREGRKRQEQQRRERYGLVAARYMETRERGDDGRTVDRAGN